MERLNTEVYCFEESIQTVSMPVLHYVSLEAETMKRKLELIRCYACQNHDDGITERKLTEARYHGWKSGCEFAECFGSLSVPLFVPPVFDFY